MGDLINLAFQIEVIPEMDGYRTIIRTWTELDSFVEIVHQEYIHGKWVDIAKLPAMNKEMLTQVQKVIDVAKDLMDLKGKSY